MCVCMCVHVVASKYKLHQLHPLIVYNSFPQSLVSYKVVACYNIDSDFRTINNDIISIIRLCNKEEQHCYIMAYRRGFLIPS